MDFCLRSALLVSLVGALIATVGCSSQETLVPVRGHVYYNDKPLEFGSVMLQPTSGAASKAKIQPDGTFELETPGLGKGARLGLNKVRVTCFEVQRPGTTQKYDGEQALGRSLIPRRYSSYSNGLTVEIKPDSNEPLEIRLTD